MFKNIIRDFVSEDDYAKIAKISIAIQPPTKRHQFLIVLGISHNVPLHTLIRATKKITYASQPYSIIIFNSFLFIKFALE